MLLSIWPLSRMRSFAQSVPCTGFISWTSFGLIIMPVFNVLMGTVLKSFLSQLSKTIDDIKMVVFVFFYEKSHLKFPSSNSRTEINFVN